MVLGCCSAVVACLSVRMLSYSHTASPAASAERPTKRHPTPTTAPATRSRDEEPATLLDQQHSTAVQRQLTRRGGLGVAAEAGRVTVSRSGDAAGGRGAAGPHPSKPTSTVSSLPQHIAPTVSSAAALQLAREGPGRGSTRWGGGCRQVFLDVGANIGVQTRKFHEPRAYPEGGTRPRSANRQRPNAAQSAHRFSWINAFAHVERPKMGQRSVCSFAFEANVVHTPRLQALEVCYRGRGWRSKIFSETAAAASNGTVAFFGDPVGEAHGQHQWAASMIQHGKHWHAMPKHTVAAVDLAWWIDHHILRRQIPAADDHALAPTVFMKLDIEGAEFESVKSMLDKGLFCGPRGRTVDLFAVEWHPTFLAQRGREALLRDAQSLITRTREMLAPSNCTRTAQRPASSSRMMTRTSATQSSPRAWPRGAALQRPS